MRVTDELTGQFESQRGQSGHPQNLDIPQEDSDKMSEDPSFFLPPKPSSLLGYHRILSPTAAVKVSPLALGGLSLGNAWSATYGRNEEPEKLLDAYISLGGNFLDISNADHAEETEKIVGEWMQKRNNRDQMVIATKYTAGYKKHDRANVPLQSNYAGNSAKSLHISVRDSLQKLATEYIDLLYVQWWDFATSVEEVMRHLHALVMDRQVLYLGISNAPAWVVVKANMFARTNGLTPFSVYQGKWNAGFRDLEAEIVLMCEDQGMGIVPYGVFGGGQLRTSLQREADRSAGAALAGTTRKPKFMSERHIKLSEVLEDIGQEHGTSLQAVVR
ncbi:hypothetical protein PRZ48_015271 [Zasmidium cellare]|uniref:NADP-dependent oxidoreductase domain-containing protein n=1 Tax=Zasmidium cellare TaxID=395010 RepID=A0ABR0DWW5_ZASCE|nr:hypothetical protein PRZ48_015271 [Zasmidium cellare]